MMMQWIVLAMTGLFGMPTAPAPPPIKAPCSLLTLEEVRKVIPSAKAAQPDRSNEKYGIFSCAWPHDGGRLMILSGEEEQTPAEEARSLVDTFADPLSNSAAKNVRFEKIAGVGDSAVAVVERADKAKGFMQNNAYIVVRRGPHQVAVLAPGLAGRERPAALAALTDLGKAVAGRLR
jgi:hypothetical protein